VGGPAQLGARPPQSLQRYCYSALVSSYLKASICSEGGTLPGEGNLCIVTVASSQHPLITGGPYLVQPDTQGQITIVAYLQAVAQQREATRPQETLSVKKKQFIVESVKPKQYQQRYLQLLLQNHEAVSQDKFDLGRTDTLMHEIALKTEEPIYVKQFKIPDSHRKEVERHVLEWLKLGVI
jgi:hypothetical protein